MGTIDRSITIGRSRTCIAGQVFNNTDRFTSSQLSEFFGKPLPFPLPQSESISARDIGRCLRRLGLEALRALENQSELIP